jgi:hypothetical protein
MIIAVSLQPEVVPVTVYVVVDEGEAETVLVLVELNPEAGLQIYVVAPDAVNIDELPLQIVCDVAETVTLGTGFTVTLAIAVSIHPAAFVPVTVYVDVDAGVAVTEAEVVELKPAAGFQV